MTRFDLYPILGLAALMATTRFHHFAPLPDASLAVFFLTGRFLASPWAFALFLAEAGLIDYLAIAYGGVSGWCVTPAYPFLLPTYGVLWLGGRLSRRYELSELAGLSAALAILSVSTLIAFCISNLSFYAFSGYFAALDLKSYAVRVLPYLVPYLAAPLIYTALILAAHRAFKQAKASLPQVS